jgi:hypothetical protein
MRRSLEVAAGCGTTPTADSSTARERETLLSGGDVEGLLGLNARLFGSARMESGAEPGDDEDDEDEDDTEDGEGEDGSDEDGDESQGNTPPEDPKDARIVQLSSEAAKKRMRIRSQSQRIAELEAENARLKGDSTGEKGKSGEEAASGPSPVEKENQELKQKLARQSILFEFNSLSTGPQAKIRFKNPATAFKLLNLDDVEIDEDGTFDGLEDAIKALAKSDPYLLEDEEDRKGRRVGQPTGRSGSGAAPSREKLLAKYPALRR